MTDEFEEIINILNIRREVCFTRKESSHEDEEYMAAFFGSVFLKDGSRVELIIAFSKHFPLCFPDFFVKNNDEFRVHVEANGKICLYDKSSVLIKKDLKEQFLLDCYDQAIDILNILPGTDEYNSEIHREFCAYWLKVAMSRMVYSCFETAGVNYEEYSILFSGKKPIVAKSINDAEVIAYNNFSIKKEETDSKKDCLIIRLRLKSNLIKIKENYKLSEIRHYILDNVTASIKKRINKFFTKKVKNMTKYIFLIYETNFGDIIFGFRIEIVSRKYIQLSNATCAKVEPVYVERIDYSYLTKRGGSYSGIKDKKVLLLGAGSVGGYLANNLCQLGIVNLDILDSDIFSEENVYRHFLGFDAAIKNKLTYKADLIKEQLENMYPYVDIDSLNYKERSVEEFLINYNRLSNYDIIISALGEPSLNLEINSLLYRHNIKVPFICCFNEPYSIGGHIIASNIDRKSCLQCLYTKVNASDVTSFRGSLVETEQSFKKNVSGCSGAFVPYSCLDSQQTAIIAAKMTIQILQQNIKENMFESWIGSAEELEENGFKVSEHYKTVSDNKLFCKSDYMNSHCSICGKGD